MSSLRTPPTRPRPERSGDRTGTKNQENCPLVVPAMILTGFLGAGQMTQLNRNLLAPDVAFKVMVLENEVGISIDHTLLQWPRSMSSGSNDSIYVLQNGCVCCLLRDLPEAQGLALPAGRARRHGRRALGAEALGQTGGRLQVPSRAPATASVSRHGRVQQGGLGWSERDCAT